MMCIPLFVKGKMWKNFVSTKLIMEKITNFILIDDDPLQLFIEEKLISKMIPDAHIISFTNAREGLEYIRKNYAAETDRPTFLLLDLEMPVMSGTEFIEAFIKTDERIRRQLEVFILSSSIDLEKIHHACSHACVSRFISKPFTVEELDLIVSK